MAVTTDTFLGTAATRQASASPLAGLIGTLRLWRKRSIERGQLAAMNHRELRDLGMSECDVYYEISKPFWRA
jgi:uncharacterized protein YjiS (DUF1127 family)